MTTLMTYPEAARAYADGVRVLFAPSGVLTGERGRRGPTSHEDLAEQAGELSLLSADLTQAAAAQLTDADRAVRAHASTSLLAKALTDLEISIYLLQAATDEEDGITWTGGEGTERSIVGLGATEERLKLLLGEVEARPEAAERGERAPRDIPTARMMLSDTIGDALALISERAGKAGQVALGGLMGLGLAEVAQAAGVVGIDIAQALGQAEKVTHLYNLFRDFAIKAYDSLVTLLGQQLAQTTASLMLDWLDKLRKGEHFGQWLEKLYETQQTSQDLSRLVADSQANLERFVAAIQGVNGLDVAYRQQIDLAEKLLRGLRFLGMVPAAALPQGRVLLAAAYIVLGAYVILAGADAVDARRLKLLNRVPGVRQVVGDNLSSVSAGSK